MNNYILVINPGSTSTKIAIYDGHSEVFTKTIDHDAKKIDGYKDIASQFDFRKESVLEFLKEQNFDIKELVCAVGRGGVGLKPVKSGAYEVNDLMIDRLKNKPVIEHASNLGAIIAKNIADEVGCKAYIYDSVATDELLDVARLSGLPEISRTSAFHALNSRATAMKVAKDNNTTYNDKNFIVAHLGGGISVSVHQKGRAIDIVADDEGPFSPERAGTLPTTKVLKLAFSGEYDLRGMKKRLRGNGGVKAYLNTTDMREVTKMANSGDEKAKLVIDAMVYQVAKSIGSLATTLNGEVDYIVVTGGIAYDKYISAELTKRVSFIAPVHVEAGENEMSALASGVYRVMLNEEKAHDYVD
ncbi:butyrate kinase [Clostridiaceae bacterium M8S5]|nr:butyrate kinase [Clostridiaceae bacterium M8S5]